MNNRTQYVRITSLNLQEMPLERIEGKITSGGSVNIDGASAVRRTTSLTMITNKIDITDYYWSLNTKFKLEVGIEDDFSGKIIWYNQGIYIITSFSATLNVNSYTINISGKDKMCQLNGENGGILPFQVDFGQEEVVDEEGNKILRKVPLKEIIRNAVHEFGQIPAQNIIIQDLDNPGKELQSYRYDQPLYLLRQAEENSALEYVQTTFDKEVYIKDEEGKFTALKLSELTSYDKDTIFKNDLSEQKFYLINQEGAKEYAAKKVSYGQSAGYYLTDLVYAGDLIANAGEAITSVLDKIKNMLGNYEYFFDLDGNFIFRRKQQYVDVSFSPIVSQDSQDLWVDSYKEEYQCKLIDGIDIISISNTPAIQNIKNDFSVWGTKKSVTGKEISAHLRYAVDVKPRIYKTYNGLVYIASDLNIPDALMIDIFGEKIADFKLNLVADIEYDNAKMIFDPSIFGGRMVDWRELIYQMAKDYHDYSKKDDFYWRIGKNNPHYPNGRTGYEQYYVDMLGFWRQLYSPETIYEKAYGINENNYKEYYIQQKTDKDTFEVKYVVPTIFDSKQTYYKKSQDYYTSGDYANWHKSVIEEPESLSFWIDFLDTDGGLSKISVKAIGCRPKVVNDKDVKAIYYKEIPAITWITDDTIQPKPGTNFLKVPPSYKKMFITSSQGKSAIEALNNLLYNHVCVSENVSITAIPNYNLEPNKKIYIEFPEAGICGEYFVSKITLPLTYNGTMNITATKIIDRII